MFGPFFKRNPWLLREYMKSFKHLIFKLILCNTTEEEKDGRKDREKIMDRHIITATLMTYMHAVKQLDKTK